MASRRQKNSMIEFIVGKLEDSRLYQIISRDHEQIMVSNLLKNNPSCTQILAHNKKRRLVDLEEAINANYHQGIYTAHVFYKDGQISFVRMVDTNMSWRADKSLKRYSPLQINQALHLRGIEKAVMGKTGLTQLIYYQPETARLKESLRIFEMKEVILDYSHLKDTEDYRFVYHRDGQPAIDYKFPVDKGRLEPAAKLTYFRNLTAQLISAEKI